MTEFFITLEGREIPIPEPVFGTVRKLSATFNAGAKKVLASGLQNEIPFEALEDVQVILTLLLGKPAEEVDQMRINLVEGLAVLEQTSRILGLKRVAPGE